MKTAEQLVDAGNDVRTDAHHSTAFAFCNCGWMPDPVPQNPDGSGDSDKIERMAAVHRMAEFLNAQKEDAEKTIGYRQTDVRIWLENHRGCGGTVISYAGEYEFRLGCTCNDKD